MNVIKTKFIFKKKDEGSDGFRYKARLVAQGFAQIEGVDYEETFSGVIDKVSLRTAIHFMAKENMTICKFDVPTAFLNAPLEEEIYVTLPTEFFDVPKDRVFRLRQALYGLKQAPRAWSKSFASALSEIGFVPVEKDPSLYVIHGNQGGSEVDAILATHVDDGLVGARDKETSNKIVRFLVSKYGVRISPDPDSFLGIDLKWERPRKDGESQTDEIYREVVSEIWS
jgi:hypothetical protein